MSGLDNLGKRLNYAGGIKAESRFQQHKLKTLKKALIYSYQGATAVLQDENGEYTREFRCLMNPDNLKPDYDNKIISIPFKDICLNKDRIGTTTEGEEEIGLKSGDVFKWKETDTFWLVYLPYLEEDAYFRADVRKCEAEIELDNGNKYKVYIEGPSETTIQWNEKNGIDWNDLNYSLVIYVTKNEETLDYFHRFAYVKIDGDKWRVKVVNPYFGEGVIKVTLGEWFNNSLEEEYQENKVTEQTSEFVIGNTIVYPFDTVVYTATDQLPTGGTWHVSDSTKAIIQKVDDEARTVQLAIVSGVSGTFNLIYRTNSGDSIIPIIIQSL